MVNLLALFACSRPSDEGGAILPLDTADSVVDSAAETGVAPVLLRGAAAKGPLALGSTVQVAEVDTFGNPTGAVYSTQTTDDLGAFGLILDYRGNVEVLVEGYAFDEIAASMTGAPLTLRAEGEIVDSGTQTLCVNVVTHLAHDRIKALMAGGASLADASGQAEEELRVAIAVGPADFDPGAQGTTMNLLGGDTDANAWLFAVSAVFLQAAWRTAGEEGEIAPAAQGLLNEVAADLADDGAIDAERTSELAYAQSHLDPDVVMANLQLRFDELGADAVVPDLTRVLGDGSDHPFVGVYELEARAVFTIEARSQSGRATVLGPGDLDGLVGDDLVVADLDGPGTLSVYAGGTPPNAEAVATIVGEGAWDTVGFDLDAGDLDGDGASDLLLGSFMSDGSMLAGPGGAWVLQGPWTGARTTASATSHLWSESDATGFGIAVGVLGDVTGDGAVDIAAGAPEYADGDGRLFVFEGPLGAELMSTEASITVSSAKEGDEISVGLRVRGPGDVDGDGLDDVVVSAHGYRVGEASNTGALGLFLAASLGGEVAFDSADALVSVTPDANVEIPVARTGDADGDGLADFLVGQTSVPATGEEPSAMLFSGGVRGELTGADATVRIFQAEANDAAGTAVSAGDVNRDGQVDILVGAPRANELAGAAFLLYGPLSGAVSLTDADARFDGTIEREAAGAVGVVAGDLDNDGLDDLVVGSGADVYVLLAGG